MIFFYKVLKVKNNTKQVLFFQNVGEKKSVKFFLLLHLCARQGTRTHHNLTYAQNVDNKSFKKFNQIKLNISFLIVGKIGPKKVKRGHTDTLKLNLC